MARFSDDEEQYTCPVHLDILSDPVVLPNCQHWICKGCLQEYVNSKNDVDPDCPECRTPLDLPLGGVGALAVNYKMREICRNLLKKKQEKALKLHCTKHPAEVLTRFCCKLECLTPVCEDCCDEEHQGHRQRSIGSAWKLVGPIIDERFQLAKQKLHTSEEIRRDSQSKINDITYQAFAASEEIDQFASNLVAFIEESSRKLKTSVEERTQRDVNREEDYHRRSSQRLQKLQQIEKHENHVRKLLSSKDNYWITEADLDALNSLNGPIHLDVPHEAPPTFSSFKFHPNENMNSILSGNLGELLSDQEIANRKRIATSALPARTTMGVMAATGGMLGTASSGGQSASRLPTMSSMCDNSTPNRSKLWIKTRVVLPSNIAHPVDVELYLQDNQFIVADMTGAVNLISGATNNPHSKRLSGVMIEPNGMRVQTLKAATSSFLLGSSGLALSADRRLFSCNQYEKHIEQCDVQMMTCVLRIGDENTLMSPRSIAHSLTHQVIYVSDTKGGIKAFDSRTGRCITTIGADILLTPTGLATDGQYRLYVADELQKQIFTFDTRTTGVRPLHHLQTSFNDKPVNCHGVDISNDGHIWVSVSSNLASYSPVNMVMEYNENGQCLLTGGWELRKPRGLRVGRRDITVVDAQDDCIVIYNTDTSPYDAGSTAHTYTAHCI